jgi:hypothetical protein
MLRMTSAITGGLTMRFPIFRLAGAAGAAIFATGAVAAGNNVDNPLMAERWKTRPVVIVAPTTTDPLLTKQQDVLQLPVNQAALKAREMVVYTVVGDVARRDGEPLPAAQARGLRMALDVKDNAPAMVFLVGKDGGTKMARHQVISAEELFGTVDAMPMMQRK